jgi:PIN domain nuclease of toxin-antitoxin system
MLNLDTHVLIKALDGSLTPRERKVLAEDPEWAISAIVLWEVAQLQELGELPSDWSMRRSRPHSTNCICCRLRALCAWAWRHRSGLRSIQS